ncbi:hypothetical protein HanRHA438_Chr13g0602071 [Helianthus annuus]|nr:hypothetical protein HanRHA438_Chr13g0602071 [Helianthus annuus]
MYTKPIYKKNKFWALWKVGPCVVAHLAPGPSRPWVVTGSDRWWVVVVGDGEERDISCRERE